MSRTIWALLVALGMMCVGVGALAGQPDAPGSQVASQSVRPALEARAIDLLKAMSGRLAAARSLSFTAVISYESSSRLGPPLVYTTKSDVLLQRQDKLRVITLGDGPASEFYYDGKTMVAFAPAENLAATAEAPPDIDEALKAAFDSHGTYFPFADVIVADPYADMADGMQRAFYMGQSRIVGGTTTDMVGVVTNGVFEQIWIGAEDKLPRRLRAVYLDDPAQLRHDMELSNWKINPAVPAGAFASKKAAKAQPMPFVHPDSLPAPTTTTKPEMP
ncbi:MAG TPA: DUF2092 domain-containing protein [Methylophilaceae bacterium]|nr:DUF2092 domain-containing protein [Methylophilaceae bacterium]HQR61249.1 DUF2092 domain-containing protein [Methylophilaceae bacterium]